MRGFQANGSPDTIHRPSTLGRDVEGISAKNWMIEKKLADPEARSEQNYPCGVRPVARSWA